MAIYRISALSLNNNPKKWRNKWKRRWNMKLRLRKPLPEALDALALGPSARRLSKHRHFRQHLGNYKVRHTRTEDEFFSGGRRDLMGRGAL